MNELKNDGNRNLAVKDTTLMEYSPREMAFVEYNPGLRPQAPMSLRDTLRVLFRHKKAIFVTFLSVVGVVALGLELQTPQYEAKVRFLIHAEKLVESPFYRELEDSFKTEMALTQSEIVKSSPVLERTVRSLKLHERPLDYEKNFASPLKRMFIQWQALSFENKIRGTKDENVIRFSKALQDLRQRIRVKPISNTNLFSIAVRDYSPVAAAMTANTVSRYYIIFDLEQQLGELQTKYGEKHPSVLQFRDEIAALRERTRRTPTSYLDIMGPASVKVLEQAPIPTDPVGFPPVLILGLAAFSGLSLGVALAFMLERMDPTLRTGDDIMHGLNLPLLGSVPVRKFGAKVLKKDPLLSTRYTKSMQNLADRMHVAMSHTGIRSVLITSCSPGEGTSLIAANLATHLSKHLGHKVLVVDANLKRPGLHKTFNVADHGGFAGFLSSANSFEESIRPIDSLLSVMPAGKCENNSLTLLNAAPLADLVKKASENYEILLIDAPNLKESRNAEVLSSFVDGMVLVIEAGHARRKSVGACLASLESKKINILGAVLNKRVFDLPEVIYEKV